MKRLGFVTLTPTGSIELTRSGGAFIDFATAGTEDHDCRIKQESNGLAFVTGGDGSANEKMRVKQDGNVQLYDGNLIVASGHGIDFSATGDSSGTTSSELFDDYEEGTWTATLGPASNEFTPTSNTNTCYYTKIGRQVTVVGIAKMTTPSSLNSYTNDSTSHALSVSGLPFTILDAINARSAATLGVGGDIQFPNGVLATHGNNNSTSFSVFVNKSNGGIRSAPTLAVSTSMNFHFSFTYFI